MSKSKAPARDRSPLAGMKNAREPAREKLWTTPPARIAKAENRLWGEDVGGKPAQGLPDYAGTPGRRVAKRIDATDPYAFPGSPKPGSDANTKGRGAA